ncbi:MAG: hypothetical protein L6R40_001986 [Gallowayella cf. fulva]|nr:MAG: hypothetical protein L6R40_001986 [Xanthomendoza cf. fulva]
MKGRYSLSLHAEELQFLQVEKDPLLRNDQVRSKAALATSEASTSILRFGISDNTLGPNAYETAALDQLHNTSRRESIVSQEGENTLASELEIMFDEGFKDTGPPKGNAFQESLAAFHRKVKQDPASTLESILGSAAQETPRRTISYAQLLYTMTQGLVEMLSVRFGSLGCYQLKDPSARFYAVSLAEDDTPTMFECTTVEDINPLHAFDSHRTVQMIEVWFSVHPLSNIVSKTLFLRDYKNNTHDPILLAVMLADASYVHEDDTTGEQRETLFRWTVKQLRDRPANECGLSTVQMLMLLGWHELCIAHARRATCYLGYAGRIVTRLQAKNIQMPDVDCSQINGIQIAQVEAEIVKNIYWLTFAITLWSFMQIDQPYPQLLPSTLPTEFPPVDESLSAVIKLDIVSDNVSTLAKQTGMIHELWPLSHIASTTAHIYALLPRKTAAEEANQSGCWQAQALDQLRLLLRANQNISTLCANIRKVLIDAVKVLEVKVENALSKALVLTAYHTTIIHLLFPRLESPEDRVTVSEDLLTHFFHSSKTLLQLFAIVDAEHDTDHLITRIRSSTFADVFVLGLDVCGRALDHFYGRLLAGSSVEAETISSKLADLTSMASDMHATSKSEILITAKNLRLVKKKLKEVKLLFHSINPPLGPESTPSLEDEPNPSLTPLDAQVPGLPPFDANDALSQLWPTPAATLDFSSGAYEMFAGVGAQAFNQIDWTEKAGNHNPDEASMGAMLVPPKVPAGPHRDFSMASSQHGHETVARVPGGDNAPGLRDMGMDMDFPDLGFLAAGNHWPDPHGPPRQR